MDHIFIMSGYVPIKEGRMGFLFYLDFKWLHLYRYTKDSQGLFSDFEITRDGLATSF